MKKGFLFTLAAALMMCFAACNPDDPTPDNQGGDDNNSSLVGNWKVDHMTFNGQEMTPENMVLVMNANGTGEVLENGQHNNNNFTWSVNNNELTVHPNGGNEYSFTIVSISATEASLTGNVIPGTDMQGDVTMHLTKVNGEDPGPGPGPGPEPNPEDFPAGTMWTCSMDETETETDEDGTWTYVTDADIIMEFASTGNNGTLDIVGTITIMMNGATVYSDNIDESDTFTWTYNEATHTGTITQSGVDEGQPYEETLDFTYNPSNETIVIVYTDDEDPNADPITYVFQRTRK